MLWYTLTDVTVITPIHLDTGENDVLHNEGSQKLLQRIFLDYGHEPREGGGVIFAAYTLLWEGG